MVGSAVSPCIKITGNAETFERMREDMDFDASPVLRGLCSMDELTDRLAGLIIRTAGGVQTKSEALGHREYFVPYKYQDRQAAAKKPCS